jgi:catechol 2,3-dioxygenase-like lactoylglutathione lyase family enzyme
MEGAPPSESRLTNLTGQLSRFDLRGEAGESQNKGRSSLCDLKERTMLDHIILSVSDVERSLAFYEAALKPLDIKFFLPYKGDGDHPDLWGFGDGKRAFFWIKQGKPDPASIHWGFMAENNGKVDEFYTAAISAGARDNISPRARVEYYPGYYAADVFDPDGYSFEVVHKS